MLALGLIIAIVGCQRKSEKLKPQPSPSPTIATLQLSPTPTPTPTATPTPAVKHVEAKPQPPPSADAVAKAFVEKITNEQERRWWEGKIRPVWEISANKAVMRFQTTRARYVVVQNLRSNGVPAAVIFCLHYRESSNDFSCHLHEGSSLLHRTRYVPKGRPLHPDPPYKWEVSAEDAIYVADQLQGDWSSIQWAFLKMEGYNGWGYKHKGVPSPYIESGTQYYSSGKYVADGHFSSSAVDQQLGCRAILIRMRERGLDPFTK
jgi:lysozyme family protein